MEITILFMFFLYFFPVTHNSKSICCEGNTILSNCSANEEIIRTCFELCVSYSREIVPPSFTHSLASYNIIVGVARMVNQATHESSGTRALQFANSSHSDVVPSQKHLSS